MEFGSTINPALGRTDYSAYTQGAAQGAQAIGQGMSNLGQGLGVAIKQFAEQKKLNKQKESAIKATTKQLEGFSEIASSLPPVAQKSYMETMQQLNDPGVSVDDKFALSQGATKTLTDLVGLGYDTQDRKMKQQMLEAQVASQNKQQAIEAARNALILGKNPAGVYSPEVLNAAEVGKMEFEGKMAPKSQDAFQTAKSAFMAQNPSATPAKLSEFVSNYQGRSQPKYVLSPSEQAQAAGMIEGEKLSAKSTQDRYDALSTSFENADKAYSSAVLFEKAASGGKVSQGAFAEPMLFLKKAAEASGLAFDVGATESSLAKSGIAGLQTTGVRAIMNGLGAMSNSDREFAVSALPAITNPAKANEYFKELAKENKKFADEDRKFIRQLERDKVKKDEILRQLDERVQGREVASTVYDRVIGSKPPASIDRNTPLNVVDLGNGWSFKKQ
jgi:hypothetical protein